MASFPGVLTANEEISDENPSEVKQTMELR
jgi:hypothetical protein